MEFRFRLARVLKVKGIWEEQAKLILAAAVAVREREERLLDQKATCWHLTWTDLTGTGLREGREIAGQYLLACLAKGDYERQTTRVQEARHKFATQQQEFLQRRADRQVLSQLEEKRRAQYILETQRTDRAQLDEVASLFHLKRQRRV
ncbi:MAG: hypothetical protein WAO22_01200 [bacterium]